MSGTNPQYDTISPLDYRYVASELLPFLSERAFVRYKCDVELALVEILCKRGLCDQSVVDEIRAACAEVTAEEVYAEEKRIGHDIRALVNCIQKRVSDKAKPFVHMTATSQDISDTANALRYRDAVEGPVHHELKRLMRALVSLARAHADTVQIGRTHGQHGVPITFGFAMAGYLNRLGHAREDVLDAAVSLQGKFAGAVGAFNASSLFFDDPQSFEEEILLSRELDVSEVSTQVVQPERLLDLLHYLVKSAGVMADLADDMRHLQRTEIGEVGEAVSASQVGSSTMPHKRNPISFENVKSLWKVVVPRMQTVYMDQLSEHQRDLTNSASGRTAGEIIAYVHQMAKRLATAMEKLSVDEVSLAKNVALTSGLILAEPLYIILASLGHPDAHEAVRMLSRDARTQQVSIQTLFEGSDALADYRDRLTPLQKSILADPHKYTGQSSQIAHREADRWGYQLNNE